MNTNIYRHFQICTSVPSRIKCDRAHVYATITESMEWIYSLHIDHINAVIINILLDEGKEYYPEKYEILFYAVLF